MDEVLRVSEAVERFGIGVTRNNIERGRWQRPCRGVVVLHNGPLTARQHLLVALASAPPGAALGGLTALGCDGFDGFEAGRPTIVLPPGGRRPSLQKLEKMEVHWSIELGEQDVHPLRSPRRTRPARSLVDAASWSTNDRYARAIVIAGVQQQLVNTRQIRDSLTRRGPCLRRALIIESVLDAAGGVQSLPERDFDQIRILAHLPRPTRQRAVQGKDGRFYLDASWESLRMSAEIHGIPHLAVQRWNADLFRANEIVIGGERLLIFSSYAIRHEKTTVADQLLRMARALGWSGGVTDLSAFEQLEQRKRRDFRPHAG